MKPFKFGLITKYSLAVAVVLTLVTFMQSTFFYQLDKMRAQATLKEHAFSLVKNLAYSSEYGILAKNISVLKRLAESMAESKEIVYLQILDQKGNVLVQVAKKLESKIPIFNIEYPVKTLKSERPPEEVFLTPISPGEKVAKEEIIGNIKLGLSHAEILKETQRMLLMASLLTLSLLATGFLGIFFFSKYFLIIPLRQFVLGTQKITRGELDYQINLKSEDEIGELAEAFDKMTTQLKKSKEEIENYTRNLEEIVKKRTSELQKTIAQLEQTKRELEQAKTGLEEEVAKRTKELEEERKSLANKVAEKTAELQGKIEELEIFHKVAVGRELKMEELEKEVDDLRKELGKAPKYYKEEIP
ncbi:MAG: HAMP domain-containing protein [Candidatus Margulisiibacteriota bacterium]